MVNLQINNLTKVYDNKEVLKNISFGVNDGEFLSILGPSGCGKTTLLKLLIGIEKPTSGEIIRNNRNITKLDSSKRGMGIVFQNYALFPNMTVLNNVMYALKIKLKNKDNAKKQAESIIKKVGLEEHINKYPHELSGGMKQRVNIARAFGKPSKIILLDEPFKSLDYKLKYTIINEFIEILKKENRMVILVTHDLDEAIYFQGNIIVLGEKPVQIKGIFTENLESKKNIILDLL